MSKNLQIIVNEDCTNFSKISEVSTGASITVNGLLTPSPAKKQAIELLAQTLIIHGSTTSSYPLQKKGHSIEFLREIGHLKSRTNTFGAVFRVRNKLSQAIHDFFRKNDFIWAHTPILTASDCEGAGDLFQVTTLDPTRATTKNKQGSSYSDDFFGKPAYLTVSGQLQAETMALGLSKVYTFGPTFRAENSNTSRHLAEFWMVEPEVAFCDLTQLISLAEAFIKSVIQDALTHCPEELYFFEKFYKNTSIKELEKVATAKFEHITYTEAIDILKKSSQTFEFPVSWGAELQTEHERYLTDVVFKCPVSVRDYPKEIKAFYMRLNDDEKTVAAMDLLIPRIGELIGGSQREERLDILEQRMTVQSTPKEDLWWYLDLRRQGSVEHAGFGLGFERLLMYITGMKNIRDVTLCPRTPKSIQF